MRAGKLDRLIRIDRYTEAQDASGESNPTWESIGTVPASVRQQSGKEAIQSEQLGATEIVVFTIRWMQVGTKDRVFYEDRVYDIQHTKEIGRRAGLELITHGKE